MPMDVVGVEAVLHQLLTRLFDESEPASDPDGIVAHEEVLEEG
jgi:hypothetical protein